MSTGRAIACMHPGSLQAMLHSRCRIPCLTLSTCFLDACLCPPPAPGSEVCRLGVLSGLPCLEEVAASGYCDYLVGGGGGGGDDGGDGNDDDAPLPPSLKRLNLQVVGAGRAGGGIGGSVGGRAPCPVCVPSGVLHAPIDFKPWPLPHQSWTVHLTLTPLSPRVTPRTPLHLPPAPAAAAHTAVVAGGLALLRAHLPPAPWRRPGPADADQPAPAVRAGALAGALRLRPHLGPPRLPGPAPAAAAPGAAA